MRTFLGFIPLIPNLYLIAAVAVHTVCLIIQMISLGELFTRTGIAGFVISLDNFISSSRTHAKTLQNSRSQLRKFLSIEPLSAGLWLRRHVVRRARSSLFTSGVVLFLFPRKCYRARWNLRPSHFSNIDISCAPDFGRKWLWLRSPFPEGDSSMQWRVTFARSKTVSTSDSSVTVFGNRQLCCQRRCLF